MENLQDFGSSSASAMTIAAELSEYHFLSYFLMTCNQHKLLFFFKYLPYIIVISIHNIY